MSRMFCGRRLCRVQPAVDIDSGLPPQVLNENIVTIIEKWETMENLEAHLKAPHMLAYREKVQIWWKEPHWLFRRLNLN